MDLAGAMLGCEAEATAPSSISSASSYSPLRFFSLLPSLGRRVQLAPITSSHREALAVIRRFRPPGPVVDRGGWLGGQKLLNRAEKGGGWLENSRRPLFRSLRVSFAPFTYPRQGRRLTCLAHTVASLVSH